MAQGFSLKDQLFNADSIGDLAAEFAAGLPGFDGPGFHADVMGGLAPLGLLERLDWIADCLEPHLSSDFPQMADQLHAAMPAPLDPALTDNDFGRFIHSVPGILAVRHGLEHHLQDALDLIYDATQRFTMELYIRPFLNRWPEETLARMDKWAGDDNYHVRRLASEGTRPRLPWAQNITIDPLEPLPTLDRLHADKTRYVTRSVANHLNDLSRVAPDAVIGRLAQWRQEGRAERKELDWLTRHALRTLIKQGNRDAMALLGYRHDLDIRAALHLSPDPVQMGSALEIRCEITTPAPEPVLVDYVMHFHTPNGRGRRKVHKLKQAKTAAGVPLILNKRHLLKGNATTFSLHPGPHRVELQVNGRIVAEADFDLQA